MNQDIKILVVDDGPDILSAAARIIQKAGYRVIKASTRKECIQRAKESKPDLIFLAVCFPFVPDAKKYETIRGIGIRLKNTLWNTRRLS